jgi:hypothetical protein
MSNYLLKSILYCLIMILGIPISLSGQTRTVGLILNNPSSFSGYNLLAPISYTHTYLIDNEGLLVNTWESSYTPGLSAYLLQNGHLLRTARLHNLTFNGGGSGGLIQEFTWDGTRVWEYEYSTHLWHQHHDVEQLPNGNVLLIAWEYKDYDEVLQAGRKPGLLSQSHLWPDHIVEVQPDGQVGGKVVWEWHVWDHLIQDYDSALDNYGIVAQHPELIDINYVNPGPNSREADWNHINAIDYNEKLDQIILTVTKFSEIWVIDHSTTTLEASGHSGGNRGMGGDLLYRWGNPQSYHRGNESDQRLFAPHDAHWIEAGLPGEGNILIFNNGRKRPAGRYSSIDEIVPSIDQQGKYTLNSDSTYHPDTLYWTYTDPVQSRFFATSLSGAQRLPNGNTLICDGPRGEVFEITGGGNIVWKYISPVILSGPVTQGETISIQENRVFKIHRYAPDFPGFSGKGLKAGNPIEIYPLSIEMNSIEFNSVNDRLCKIYPNPANDVLTIETVQPGIYSIELTLINGQLLYNSKIERSTHQIDLSSFEKGLYLITIRSRDYVKMEKIVKF